MIKKYVAKRFLIVVLAFAFVLNCFTAETVDAEKTESYVDSISELNNDSYSNYLKKHENAQYIYSVKNISISENDNLSLIEIENKKAFIIKEGNSADISVSVDQSGLYNIGFTYYPLGESYADIEAEIKIDDELPFSEFASNTILRKWHDAETLGEKTDRNGNALLPKQEEIREWSEVLISDFSGSYIEPYYVFFEKGKHIITVTGITQSFAIHSINIGVKAKSESYKDKYEEYKNMGLSEINDSTLYMIEAENTLYKSSASLVAKTDYSSPLTTPYSPSKIRLNTIGGSSFSQQGQWLEWEANVEQSGLYNVSFRCRQNFLSGAFVTRKLYVNGEIPYKELENIRFYYDSDWQIVTAETPIPLKKGKNIIRLEVTMGELSEIADGVEAAVQELNYAYRQIVMITGVNPDKYRDYQLETYAPNALDLLKTNESRIKECNDKLIKLTGKRGSANGALQTMVALLNEMNDKDYDIQNKLSLFKDDIASLSSWLTNVRTQSLELDKLYIHGANADLGKAEAGFLKKLKHEFVSFLSTFSEDYTSIGIITDTNEKIEVWIAAGRDQANILNNLISEYFSPEYNIGVDLKLVQGQLLAATASGIGPDVALQIGQGEPVNYALRKASLDLTQFDDFSDIQNRFDESAVIPFRFNDGVYGLPETQIFPVMFIRTDIFAELGLSVPENWEEFLNVVGRLQKKNMSGGITAPNNDSLSTFAMFLYQNGGSFYSTDESKSSLDSNEAIAAFKQMTFLFTDYGFPTQYDALNRFRSGEMPLLINDYTLYNSLAVGAPEISGLWKIYPVPATVNKDGTVNNAVASSGTACMILSATDKKESAWEFTKWWTSENAQSEYGRNIEILLGTSARYCSANKAAFAILPWSKEELNTLDAQRKTVVGIPQVAGGYFTSRHINNAFRKVINQKTDPKETLLTYVKTINDEIKYKRYELGLQ